MSEAEWLGCAELSTMVVYLRGKTTLRKRQLLGCAACRLLFPHFFVEGLRQLSDAYLSPVEAEADGEAIPKSDPAVASHPLGYASNWLLLPWYVLANEADDSAIPVVREIFHPFPRPPLRPEWLAWNDGFASKLAAHIDCERAFDQLGILGDALEEAGCPDAVLLAHLHAPGQHMRGCWALDVVLGKE